MIEIIITTIFVSTILNIFLKKFQIPTIVWYILTWIFISYFFSLNNYINNYDLKLIAEFWIVFLMFTIWLEFPIRQLIKIKKNVFIYWSCQFLLTSILFYLISVYWLWFDNKVSFLIWVWLSLSSTAIVLKLLKENNNINKEYWQKSLWMLLFQDLAIMPIMLMIPLLSIDDSHISILLLKVFFWVILLFIFLLGIWKYLLSPFLYWVTKTESNEIFISSILLIVLCSSYIAHYLWLSYSLWALIAWVMIAETTYKYQVEADLIPFRNLLLWIFFITVWMQLDFLIIINNLWIIIPFLFFWIILKILIIFWILSFVTKKRIALETWLSLFQFWEFWIVIFELGISNNIIMEKTWQIIIVIIIISMILTPFILKHIKSIALFLTNDDSKYFDEISNEYSDHIVLIWHWRIWKIISKLLHKSDYDYLVVEKDTRAFKEAKRKWIPIIYWNASQKHILKALNVHKASYVIISLWKNDNLYLICEAINTLSPDSKIIVKVNKFEEKEMLKDLDISTIIVETEETALSMFNKIEI